MTAMTIKETDSLPVAGPRVLDATDRCDSCGARAWVRAVLPASELLFCAHHAARHLPALKEAALFVQDDRELMDE